MKRRTSATRTVPQRVAGFTLIEVMITMAIVALLAMIAYPSFMQSIRNSNRSDAQAALARVSVNLERFFATNGTYTANSALIGLQVDGGTAYSRALITRSRILSLASSGSSTMGMSSGRRR